MTLGGCCSCESGPDERGPKRPGDVVRDLRDAIGGRRWADAKACFSDELQARHGEKMLSGEFFSVRGFWRDPTTRELEVVSVARPLGPGDDVLAVDLDGAQAVATLAFAQPVAVPSGPLGSWADPRSSRVVLRRSATGWRIAACGEERPSPYGAPLGR
jgi:hypothetical protein